MAEVAIEAWRAAAAWCTEWLVARAARPTAGSRPRGSRRRRVRTPPGRSTPTRQGWGRHWYSYFVAISQPIADLLVLAVDRAEFNENESAVIDYSLCVVFILKSEQTSKLRYNI